MGFVLQAVTLSTNAGANYVLEPTMKFRKIVQVSREGIVYDFTTAAFLGSFIPPANSRKVCYIAAFGEFIFPTDATFNQGETITVKWKE